MKTQLTIVGTIPRVSAADMLSLLEMRWIAATPAWFLAGTADRFRIETDGTLKGILQIDANIGDEQISAAMRYLMERYDGSVFSFTRP